MRPHKYGVAPRHRRTLDGVVFDSRKEMVRYAELKVLLHAKRIRDLRLQPAFDLDIGGVHICRYIADFSYEEKTPDGWVRVIEDAKGVRTQTYRLKKRLMLALHGIEVRET